MDKGSLWSLGRRKQRQLFLSMILCTTILALFNYLATWYLTRQEKRVKLSWLSSFEFFRFSSGMKNIFESSIFRIFRMVKRRENKVICNWIFQRFWPSKTCLQNAQNQTRCWPSGARSLGLEIGIQHAYTIWNHPPKALWKGISFFLIRFLSKIPSTGVISDTRVNSDSRPIFHHFISFLCALVNIHWLSCF